MAPTDPKASVDKVKQAAQTEGIPGFVKGVVANIRSNVAEFAEKHAAATTAAEKDAVVAEYLPYSDQALTQLESEGIGDLMKLSKGH